MKENGFANVNGMYGNNDNNAHFNRQCDLANHVAGMGMRMGWL